MNLYPLEQALVEQLPTLPSTSLSYEFSVETIDRVPKVVIAISEEDEETGFYIPLFASTIDLALAYYIVNEPDEDTVPYYIFPETIEEAPTHLIKEDIKNTVDSIYSAFSMFLNLLGGIASF